MMSANNLCGSASLYANRNGFEPTNTLSNSPLLKMIQNQNAMLFESMFSSRCHENITAACQTSRQPVMWQSNMPLSFNDFNYPSSLDYFLSPPAMYPSNPLESRFASRYAPNYNFGFPGLSSVQDSLYR